VGEAQTQKPADFSTGNSAASIYDLAVICAGTSSGWLRISVSFPLQLFVRVDAKMPDEAIQPSPQDRQHSPFL
jgi:hypothetical protein